MYETLKVESIPVTSDWSITPVDDRHDHPALRPMNAATMRMFNISPGSNVEIPDFALGADFSRGEVEHWSLRLANTIYLLNGAVVEVRQSSMNEEEKTRRLADISSRLVELSRKDTQLHETLSMSKLVEDGRFTVRPEKVRAAELRRLIRQAESDISYYTRDVISGMPSVSLEDMKESADRAREVRDIYKEELARLI